MKMNKILIARVISHLTNAPLFALYVSLIILTIEPTLFMPFSPLEAFTLAVIFLTILPPAPIPIATLLGHTDIFVSQQEKRPLFFIFAVSMHLLGSVISLLLGASLFALFMLSYATVTASLLIINFKTKVSVHTAGVTGPLTYVVYFLGIEYAILYLLVIPVIWARHTLRAHTITQLTLGVVDSIVVTFVTCTLWTIITIP